MKSIPENIDTDNPITGGEIKTILNYAGINRANLQSIFVEPLINKFDEYARSKQMEDNKHNQKIVSEIGKLNDTYADMAAAIRELTRVITSTKSPATKVKQKTRDAKQQPLFSSIKTQKEQEEWVFNTNKDINKFAIKNDEAYWDIYNAIYKGIRSEGYDVYKLCEENKKELGVESIIKVCSKSDKLMRLFDKYKDVVIGTNKYKPYYAEANGQPKEVRDLIRRFNNSEYTYGNVARNVFKILRKEYGVDVERLQNIASNKYGLKHVSASYAIYDNKDAMDKLKLAAEKYGRK